MNIAAAQFMDLFLRMAPGSPSAWLPGVVQVAAHLTFNRFDNRRNREGKLMRPESANNTETEDYEDDTRTYTLFATELHGAAWLLNRLVHGAHADDDESITGMTIERLRECGFKSPLLVRSDNNQWRYPLGLDYARPGTGARTVMIRKVEGDSMMEIFRNLTHFAAICNFELTANNDPTTGSPRYADLGQDELIWGQSLVTALSGIHIDPEDAPLRRRALDLLAAEVWLIYTAPANIAGKRTLYTDGLITGYTDADVDEVRMPMAGGFDRMSATQTVAWQNGNCPTERVSTICGEYVPKQDMSHMQVVREHSSYVTVREHGGVRGAVTQCYKRWNTTGDFWEIGAQSQVCELTSILVSRKFIKFINEMRADSNDAPDISAFPEKFGEIGLILTRLMFPNGYNGADANTLLDIKSEGLEELNAAAFAGGRPNMGFIG
jgi:hypothetical protein